MNSVISQMLERYKLETKEDYYNALKEIVQEIALSALADIDFFEHAAFYGGTALRIFYGLNRYSEDLDFSLMKKEEFHLENYFSALKNCFFSLGMSFSVENKEKNIDTTIQSAFLKGNTLEHMLLIEMSPELSRHIQKNENLKIKMEVDVDPPALANYEFKKRVLPTPYQVRLYDKPSLFAGKLHAILARGWKNRIKGRDFYDYLYYVGTKTAPNLNHLRERLIESDKWQKDVPLTMKDLHALLINRMETVDFDNAKEDVLGFVKNPKELDMWDKDFFISITDDYFSTFS